MRCEASEDCVGRTESACRTAPVGDTSTLVAPAPPTSAIAASAAIAPRLTQRSARCLIEEVQVLRVDGDRDAVADVQLHVRREGGDEIRTGADDARLVLALERLLGRGGLGPELARLHLEVRHRLAAERLDELNVRDDLRHALVVPRGMQVA